MRIVSLLPSATETVCALGLTERLVGISHSCDPPPGGARPVVVTRTRVPREGSSREIDRFVRDAVRRGEPLYEVDAARLRELAPDLVLTQALCAVCAVPEALAHAAAAPLPPGVRVLSLAPHGLGAALAAIEAVACAAGVAERGAGLARSLAERIEAVRRRSAGVARAPRVALLEWIDPPFSCGHWGPELVRLAGGVEGIARGGEPSRTLDWSELVDWQPEVLFLACCGFSVERTLGELPSLRARPGYADLPAVRDGRVFVADGRRYFSRPGPHLVDSLEQLAHALHPDRHPPPAVDPTLLLLPPAGAA